MRLMIPLFAIAFTGCSSMPPGEGSVVYSLIHVSDIQIGAVNNQGAAAYKSKEDWQDVKGDSGNLGQNMTNEGTEISPDLGGML